MDYWINGKFISDEWNQKFSIYSQTLVLIFLDKQLFLNRYLDNIFEKVKIIVDKFLSSVNPAFRSDWIGRRFKISKKRQKETEFTRLNYL